MLIRCLALLSLVLASTTVSAEDAYYNVRLNKGSAHDKGVAIGQTMRGEIQARLADWEALLTEYVGKTGSALLDDFEPTTQWRASIRAHVPDLLDEINGMAAGAQVDADSLLTYNLAEEIMTVFNQRQNRCSSFAAYLPEAGAVAYNLDIPDFLHGNQKPFVVNDEQKSLRLGFPGLLAASVITPAFSVTTNSLPDLVSDGQGLGLTFALRLMAKQSSVEQLVALIENLDFAIAQNLLITSRDQIINIEVSAKHTIVHRVPKKAQSFSHTNFALFNEEAVEGSQPEICERYEALNAYVAAQKNISTEAQLIKGIRQTEDDETFYSVLITHTPKKSGLRLFTPGSEIPYRFELF